MAPGLERRHTVKVKNYEELSFEIQYKYLL